MMGALHAALSWWVSATAAANVVCVLVIIFVCVRKK
jgi:hypothetical protein